MDSTNATDLALLKRYNRLCTSPGDMQAHMPRLAALAKGKHIVEIGFREGISATAWLHGGATRLDAIDIHPLPVPPELQATGRIHMHVGDSLQIPCIEADIVFIDGNHIGMAPYHDFLRWEPFARERIVMHDTCCTKFPYLRACMTMAMRRTGTFAIEHDFKDCHGLTILRRK